MPRFLSRCRRAAAGALRTFSGTSVGQRPRVVDSSRRFALVEEDGGRCKLVSLTRPFVQRACRKIVVSSAVTYTTSGAGGSKSSSKQLAQRCNHKQSPAGTTTLQRVVISRNAPWSLADQGGVALIACSTNSATRRLLTPRGSHSLQFLIG